jgi:hypothetical protein
MAMGSSPLSPEAGPDALAATPELPYRGVPLMNLGRLLPLATSLVVLFPACAREAAPPPVSAAPACAAAWTALPATSPSLAPPEPSLRVVLHAAARGTQDYECASSAKDAGNAFAWTLKGPEADLADCNGAPLGRHFASEGGAAAPKWEARDGSFVVGKKVASEPSSDPGSIPSLLVQVTASGGAGALGGVAYVQRTNTKGGVAPGDGCDAAHAGSTRKVSYSADYWFVGK